MFTPQKWLFFSSLKPVFKRERGALLRFSVPVLVYQLPTDGTNSYQSDIARFKTFEDFGRSQGSILLMWLSMSQWCGLLVLVIYLINKLNPFRDYRFRCLKNIRRPSLQPLCCEGVMQGDKSLLRTCYVWLNIYTLRGILLRRDRISFCLKRNGNWNSS